MKLDLKKPCPECPFTKGSITNQTLAEGRLEGIVEDIRNDMSFTCHKTLEKPASDQQHCAGAMIYLERENRPNQIMRVMERFRVYDRNKLDMDANIIDEIEGE